MSKLTEFYKMEKPDVAGRDFVDMVNFNADELEYTHDYIQWLFPLPETSQFNADAPVLSQEDINEVQSDPLLKHNLDRSYKTMLSFYGFEENEKTKAVSKTPNFEKAAENWLTPLNHNFLRISRILRSLSLLGAEEKSKEFFEALKPVYADNQSIVGERTFGFWKAGSESVSPKPLKSIIPPLGLKL